MRTWIIVVAVILLVPALTVGILYAFNPSFFQNSLFQSSETTNRVKTIRLYEPTEIAVNASQRSRYIEFMWTPNNPTNNAIIYMATYFQFFTPNNTYIDFSVGLNGEGVILAHYLGADQYRWSRVYGLGAGIGSLFTTMPNQENYTIRVTFARESGTEQFYVKNLNIILQVVDGLPPT